MVHVRIGRSPLAMLADIFGSARAAAHFSLLIEEIGAAWPDPFCCAPPCCRAISVDEATFVQLLGAGFAGDRPGFDRIIAEMLPTDVRDRLFHSIDVFGRVLAGKPGSRC